MGSDLGTLSTFSSVCGREKAEFQACSKFMYYPGGEAKIPPGPLPGCRIVSSVRKIKRRLHRRHLQAEFKGQSSLDLFWFRS